MLRQLNLSKGIEHELSGIGQRKDRLALKKWNTEFIFQIG